MTDPLEILQAVNAYFEAAFNHLLTLTLAILGLGGVVIPLIWQLVQFRSFRSEKSSLEGQIESKIQQAKDELRKVVEEKFLVEKGQLQQLFKSQTEEITSKMAERVSAAKAGTFFLQAIAAINLGDFEQATMDFATAAQLAFDGKEDTNGQRALDRLITECIPELTSENFEGFRDIDNTFDELIKALDSRNENGRFTDEITQIKVGREKAKKRQRVTSKATGAKGKE